MPRQKNIAEPSVKALDGRLIDKLYKELTEELSLLVKELNDSSKISAFGAMATLSRRISDIAADLKKLQHLPNMLRNPFIVSDPRAILDDINKKYKNRKRNS